MPLQRKVFRIEEGARERGPNGVAAGVAENAARHREFIGELQTLRALIAPSAPVDRSSMERARAQIAEAQAYKGELELIHAAIERTRGEIDAQAASRRIGERSERMGRELQAIVAGTERAAQSILQAAEEIDRTSVELLAGLDSEHDKALALGIRQRVVQIFEACNFQDLTGQRVANVVEALKVIEDHLARLKSIWLAVEEFKPVVFDDASGGAPSYLNGPKLPDDNGHSTQDDIDGMFGCA